MIKQSTRQGRLAALVVATTATAAASIAFGRSWPDAGAVGLTAAVFWLVLSLAAETFWLPTKTGQGMVSMSLMANAAALLTLPTPLALCVAGASVGLADLLLHHRPPVRSLFNASQTVVALAASAALMGLLGAPLPLAGSRLVLLSPGAVVAFLPAFCAVNTLLVAAAISLSAGGGVWRTWRTNFGHAYHYWNSIVLFLLAVGLVLTVESIGYVAGLVSLVFLIVLRDAYRLFLSRGAARARV